MSPLAIGSRFKMSALGAARARASPVTQASSSAVAATTATFAFYLMVPNHLYSSTGTTLKKVHPMQTILARPQMGSQRART
jgi:hypothetical protein